MKNRGETFAFVIGLSAGIFNLLIGCNALLGGLMVLGIVPAQTLTVMGLLFAATAVNFAGGCACRSHRVAGGVMMLLTAFPLLISGALMICVRILPQELIAQLAGEAFDESVLRMLLGIGILLLIVEAASVAAAIVSLAAGARPEGAVYAPPAAVESGAEVKSFAEQYASRLRQKEGEKEL